MSSRPDTTHSPHEPWPSPSGRDLAVLPGDRPGTALRIRSEDCPHGCVRLEQLAYNRGLGWYVQKTLCVPRTLVRDLARTLRIADCLTPRGHDNAQPAPGQNFQNFRGRDPYRFPAASDGCDRRGLDGAPGPDPQRAPRSA